MFAAGHLSFEQIDEVLPGWRIIKRKAFTEAGAARDMERMKKRAGITDG